MPHYWMMICQRVGNSNLETRVYYGLGGVRECVLGVVQGQGGAGGGGGVERVPCFLGYSSERQAAGAASNGHGLPCPLRIHQFHCRFRATVQGCAKGVTCLSPPTPNRWCRSAAAC